MIVRKIAEAVARIDEGKILAMSMPAGTNRAFSFRRELARPSWLPVAPGLQGQIFSGGQDDDWRQPKR